MAFSSEAALIPTGARASPQLRNNQMTPNQAQSIPAHVFEETGIVLLASCYFRVLMLAWMGILHSERSLVYYFF